MTRGEEGAGRPRGSRSSSPQSRAPGSGRLSGFRPGHRTGRNLLSPRRVLQPPRFTRLIFERLVEAGIRDAALGDLHEQFLFEAKVSGLRRARRRYRRQVAAALPGCLKNRLSWSWTMIGFYMKLYWRTLKRHKGHAFVNLVGLTIGLTGFLLIFLYVRHETSYDSSHIYRDRVYRVQGEQGQQRSMAPAVAVWISQRIPEAEEVVRFKFRHDYLVKYRAGEGEDSSEETTLMISDFGWADPSVFEVFTFPLVSGDPRTALRDPFAMVLTETTARRIFGDTDPIGKTLLVDNRSEYHVTGVMKDPRHTHLNFDLLASFSTLGRTIGQHELDSFNSWNLATYVRLPQEHDTLAIAAKITDLFRDKLKELWNYVPNFELLPLKDVYFAGSYSTKEGNRPFVRILAIVGLFLLLAACVNFINLSTARASLRAREVGIKKTVGSTRSRLVAQFLSESILFCLTACVVSLGLCVPLLPVFNRLVARELSMASLTGPVEILGLAGGAVMIGLLSGLYPSLFLSRFRPVEVMRGGGVSRAGSGFFRKGLICFQFAVSIALILATLIVAKQMRFLQSRELGFSRDPIVYMEVHRNPGIRNRKREFQARLKTCAAVRGVTFSQGRPGLVYNWEGFEAGDEREGFAIFTVDPDYLDVYGLNLLEGRWFDWERRSDRLRKCLLNQAAVRKLGLEHPVGTVLRHGDLEASSFPVREVEVIGVIEDFHYQSLHYEIQPQMFGWNDPWLWMVSVRMDPARLAEGLTEIRKAWQEFSPDYPFSYRFVDDLFAGQYQNDRRFGRMIAGFTGMGILIAVLGLLGLASFMAERRTREIGIRRVLGASVWGIISMLVREFSRWVLLANLIAWPVGILVMRKWLQNFAFRVSPGVLEFVLAGGAALLIAWLTVAQQTIRAASASPSRSLRSE